MGKYERTSSDMEHFLIIMKSHDLPIRKSNGIDQSRICRIENLKSVKLKLDFILERFPVLKRNRSEKRWAGEPKLSSIWFETIKIKPKYDKWLFEKAPNSLDRLHS